jgi:F-type H+-transporting ATPase subunit delta
MKISKRAKRTAGQLLRLCRVNGVLDEDRARQVVRHLIATGYREAPAVLAQFLRLVRLDREEHTVRITSAAPLPDDVRAITEANLFRFYGPGLITAFSEQPSLIGGMRIQVGSDVYDGTVLGRLAALDKSF